MESSLYDEYVSIEDTHWWFRGRREIIATLLRPHMRSPARIIDIGSGGGAVAQALLEFGSVTACDIDVRCAASVARRAGMSFAYGTAEAVPFADGSFDLVTAFDVLEHLDDDVKALREMARRPAGVVDGAAAIGADGCLAVGASEASTDGARGGRNAPSSRRAAMGRAQREGVRRRRPEASHRRSWCPRRCHAGADPRGCIPVDRLRRARHLGGMTSRGAS